MTGTDQSRVPGGQRQTVLAKRGTVARWTRGGQDEESACGAPFSTIHLAMPRCNILVEIPAAC
jgi:hypothetical protein